MRFSRSKAHLLQTPPKGKSNRVGQSVATRCRPAETSSTEAAPISTWFYLSSCVVPEKPACRKHPVREHKVQVRLGEQESSDESPKANFVFVLDVLVDLGFCFGKFNERMRVLPLLRGAFRLNVCETVGRDVAMDGGPVKW